MTNNAGKLKQRRYFNLPVWEQAPAAMEVAASEAMDAWKKFSLRMRDEIVDSEGRMAPHRLMLHYRKPPTRVDWGRSHLERAIADAHRDQWTACLRSEAVTDFTATLESVASAATGTEQVLRDGPVFTSPDTEGVRVVFPRPGTFQTRLTALRLHIAEDRSPPIVRAAVALVALTNCHPFRDGNGRTARIVTNLILNEETPRNVPLHYLPLYELGNSPPGNLTLYKRSAEVLGEWSALLVFFREMLNAARTLPTGTTQDSTA